MIALGTNLPDKGSGPLAAAFLVAHRWAEPQAGAALVHPSLPAGGIPIQFPTMIQKHGLP